MLFCLFGAKFTARFAEATHKAAGKTATN